MNIDNSTVDPKLLEILVCPLTKGPLQYDHQSQELISEQARDCTMRNPWSGQSARLYRNGELSAVMSGTTFAFPTARGEVIRLLP